ncbi:MAG: peptidyl-prolyl cis-trans isomerase, partial [Candidatus Eisenbacteria bacterium]|nr:peptidyl-prolyl cis-trans isomerase [Candidatus Eisenbacteria bacterium]
MRRMIIFVTSFAVLAAPCLFAQVTATGDTAGAAAQYKLANVVARVNGHVITDDLLYQRLFRLHGAQVLGQMISEMLVEDEARAQSIEIPEKDLDARFAEFTHGFATPADLENWLRQQGLRREDVKAQLRLGMLQEGIVTHARGLSVTPEEVAAFFEQNKDRLGTPEHYRLRHILLASQAEAEEALIALQAGADFAKLAALKSQDAATKDAGGDLGFLTLAALAPELQQALAELPV